MARMNWTPETLEALYLHHEGMIWKAINDLQQTYHYALDESDLLSHAHELFMDAALRWDPDKSAFSTFFYWQLQGLKAHGMRLRSRQEYEDGAEYEIVDSQPSPMEDAIRQQALDRLSPDGSTMLAVISNGDFDTAIRRRRPSLSRAQVIMKEKAGWTPARTRDAWEDLETCYRRMAVC